MKPPPAISHDRAEDTLEAKARWYQSLSVCAAATRSVLLTEQPDAHSEPELFRAHSASHPHHELSDSGVPGWSAICPMWPGESDRSHGNLISRANFLADHLLV